MPTPPAIAGMEQLPASLGVTLAAQAWRDSPPRFRGGGLPSAKQLDHDRIGSSGAGIAGDPQRGKDLGQQQGPDLGRRIPNNPSRNEVLQQREARVVE